MRKWLFSSICICAAVLVQAQTLYVGSYNIRYQNKWDAEAGNGWEQRKSPLCDQIAFEHPDIFGTQEVLEQQLYDILGLLPGYDYIGKGRDDGIHGGEHEAIFYDRQRLTLLDHDDFWLSETPDKPGLGWDAACIRICTWGHFEDKQNQWDFYFFNLHMDHVGIVARQEAAKLVTERIRTIAGDKPVILTGDFNVDQTNIIYSTFTDSGLLDDSYEKAQRRFAENGTFNSFNPDLKTTSRIDHVFVSPCFTVERYGVLTNGYWTSPADSVITQKGHDAPSEIDFTKYEKRVPSDHYPVFVRLSYPAKTASATVLPTVGKKMPALDASAWKVSEWISVKDAPVAEGRADQILRAADGANWFVTTLKNKKNVISAKWMATGLGVFELYVNGQVVGEEVLKPGFTHHAKTKRSFTYDITDAIRKQAGNENTFSAQVTPGWWADKIVTPGEHDGMIGKKCAFRGVLELTFADGSKQYCGTDCDHWKAGIAGPVRHAAIFDGEEYDARELPGYATPGKLSKPEINTEFNGEILPSEGAEIYLRHDLALKPVKTYVWEGVIGEKLAENQKDTEHGKVIIKRSYLPDETILLKTGETLVIDFGQNCAAVPYFEFEAQSGTVLTCLPGEMLNDGNGSERRGMDGPEGSVHRRNLRMQDKGMRLTYTFGETKGAVRFQPRATFFGYRYISITATGEVKIQVIESIPITSIAKDIETGTITTGNNLINQLISNTLWGQRSNYLSVPTDCPQRDERLGWTADTQVFAETGTFFANTNRFFHKWMRDMCDSQGETGGFPGVAPTAQYGNEMMRLGWADAGIIVPWTIWKQYGDKAIIDENWEAMDRFMQYVNDTKYDHPAHAKENGDYQWADWLSCEPLETCTNKAFDENWKRKPEAISYWSYLGASYWVIDAEMMRDMARASGREAAKYQQMADAARAYIKETFLNDDGTFKTAILNTMQTPALFALKNRIVEGAAKEQMLARLRQNFADHDNCLQTGFLGTSILMATLTEYGLTDIAFELLFQNKNPSWIYSIDNGATTIWERWNSYMKDHGMGPVGMNSFNHYAYGCVCQWLWESVAGIAADPAQPGFKHIIMSPVADRRLGFINAEYLSAAGLIKSAWKYEGEKWIWDFTIPEGATATVTLPGESTSKEYKSGTYHIVR